MDVDLLAMTRDQVARLTGLSMRQIDYWDRTGLISPGISERLTPHRRTRLYQYADVMALLVVAELRTRKVSLQLVRAIVTRLRQQGIAEPLTQLRFATHGKQIYLQLEDGAWESGELPGQAVVHEVIDLEPLRARLRAAGGRRAGTHGQIDRRRGTKGNKLLVAGTRIPVDTITRYLRHGADASDILRAYPELVAQDIDAVRREVS